MLSSTKLKRTSLVDQAVDQLRREILDGSLPPGAPLPESQVGESLGIARPTVREVLLRLQNEGLVRWQGRGVALAVTRIDREQLADIYTARLHLELAGARSYSTARQEDKDSLDSSVEALDNAIASADRITQIQLDAQCHIATVALTGSQRLITAHIQLLTESRLAAVTAGLSNRDIVSESHHEFVNLLRVGKTELACDQLRRRLEVARAHIADNLPT